MSHFTVMVIGENVEAQLAPFQESDIGVPKEMLEFVETEPYGGEDPDPETGKYGYWKNPNAKWDWWVVGGRWSNTLHLKRGGKVDTAIKRDIDFELMKREAREEALERRAIFQRLMGGELPAPAMSWDEVWEGPRFKDLTIAEKRSIYWGQPPLQKLSDLRSRSDQLTEEEEELVILDDYSHYCIPEEEFIARAEFNGVGTFAFLRDGKWAEKGKMGWWSSVSDMKKDWSQQFLALLDAVPDSERITIVDCHI